MDIAKYTSKDKKESDLAMFMTTTDLNQQYSDKDKWPTFANSEVTTNNTFETVCDIPAELSYFAGHFPDQAVLPGVVQINWANTLATKLFNVEEFRGVNSLKFNSMILPKTKVTLSLTFNPDRLSVKFSYKTDDLLFSSGVLIFAATTH